jgi:hypothetical protein
MGQLIKILIYAQEEISKDDKINIILLSGMDESRKESFIANKIVMHIFVDSTYNAYVTRDFTNAKKNTT